MYNRCQRISDFYEGLIKSGKHSNIISQQTAGPFGGKTVSYTVLTDTGTAKVRCDYGINTFRYFHPVEVLLVGSVRGRSSGGNGSVGSEGSSWKATDISEVSPTGECHIKTLFGSADVRLPIPMLKQ
jgi:hypothetical protein